MVLKKLCVYGGTFDPVHLGHLLLANYIKEELGVEKFMFIPTFLPPHKTDQQFSSFTHRYNMLKLALKDSGEFLISDIEYQRQGTSYSYLTIDQLRKEYVLSREDFYFLIGGDSLVELHQWREPEKILDNASVVVMNRPGSDFSSVSESFLNKVQILNTPLVEISSTDVRNRIKTGGSIKYMVPDSVEKYIHENGLYL